MVDTLRKNEGSLKVRVDTRLKYYRKLKLRFQELLRTIELFVTFIVEFFLYQ